jgi:DtxR family Mn-dependent transcriptional regulator
MATSTVENYLKELFAAQQRRPGKLVLMGVMAKAVRVQPGTATAMIKALADSGLVDYAPRGGVRLSASGEQLALHVLRRHRLVEQFLVDVLGLDWSEVHEEAEELEHAISDKVLEKIDLLLGHPQVDPHGDPIPSARGKLARLELRSLAECRPGQKVKVRRVLDQEPTFLQFAQRHGLRPGCDLQVVGMDAAADAVTVEGPESSSVTLGRGAAAKVLVESEATGG